jgi:hypothetical protein
MNEVQALVGQALAGDGTAVDALVAHLGLVVQRQVNAGLLRRSLVAQAQRHHVVDLVRDILRTLFAGDGLLLRTWDGTVPLETYVEHLAYTEASRVLNQAVPLPPELIPPPGEAEAWWLAASYENPLTLPVAPEHRGHAQVVLRPLLPHERHAIAAELVPHAEVFPLMISAIPTADPAPAPRPPGVPITAPSPVLDVPEPGPAPRAPAPRAPAPRAGLGPRQRASLAIAGGLALLAVGGVVVDRLTGDAWELPPFELHARPGLAGAAPVYIMGQQMQVILHPVEPIPWAGDDDELSPLSVGVAAVALGPEDEKRRWRHSLERTADGDFQLSGTVGDADFPVTPGRWKLVFLVGPPQELEALAVNLASSDEPVGPPFRRTSHTIMVQAAATAETP